MTDGLAEVPEYVHEALAARHKAEAAKSSAEARLNVAAAKITEIDLAQRARIEHDMLTADAYHGVYRFSDVVGDSSVNKCIEQLETWNRQNDLEDTEIIFYSPGGSILSGFALWDYLRTYKKNHKLTTTARGYAASMAGILLQAGHHRQMGSESWILIHEGSMGIGGSVGEVEDQVEWSKKLRDRLADILADRSTLNARQIKAKWKRKDWWVGSDEALEFGFVDEIV
jgi:ATP-dependent Clp protease protease subunit